MAHPTAEEIKAELVRLILRYDAGYDQNGVQYLEGPILFAREMLGIEPDEKQQDILRAVARGDRRISVRSGHGVGKTTTLAVLIIWHLFVKMPQKTVCTAPTKTQLFDALAAETKTLITKLPAWAQSLFDVKSESIHHVGAPNESFATFATSRAEQPEALAGKHSEWVLLIVDEASGIPDSVFEAASGSMSGHHATMILAGNPVRTSGMFFRTHNKPEVMALWTRFHISCVGHPRITDDFLAMMKADYGEDSNAYRVRVLGEFPRMDDDTVIPFELAEAARTREITASPSTAIVWGLDCARFGDDSSALAKRRGPVLLEQVREFDSALDLMQLAGRVKAEYDSTPPNDRPVEINIDTIGIGAGVHDRLREQGLPVRGINVSESPSIGDHYVNQRAELWFKGKEFFAKRDCSLHNDEKLVTELTIPRFSFQSNGKILVESKKDMKKRGFKSPNRADAFLLTLATDAIIAQQGSNYGAGSWKTPLKRNIRGIV